MRGESGAPAFASVSDRGKMGLFKPQTTSIQPTSLQSNQLYTKEGPKLASNTWLLHNKEVAGSSPVPWVGIGIQWKKAAKAILMKNINSKQYR